MTFDPNKWARDNAKHRGAPTNTPLCMICKLKVAHITEEGDFIPAGMLVQVLQWKQHKSAEAFVEVVDVRVAGYMFADSVSDEKLPESDGAIGRGLHIRVKATDLVFHSMSSLSFRQ